jgi:phage terminase large subunit
MATIDLNNCFPEGKDGTRRPLPKQAELLRKVLAPAGSKYIAYVGGIGSGKSLIGCIAMLSQAVMYPGDYLIARQFLPELKITTYKTFLEICPPELIQEHRIADMMVKIKCGNGKFSNIYFRQLEEPDKLRSLNLSGFLIDEANQVSEEAFILLQGRLRGAGLRKGIIVSNPNGHDWLYRWFFKKDHLKTEQAKNQLHLIMAPSTENVHLPDGYIQSMMEAWSEDRIKREIMGSFDAFEGMVYHEFRRDVHVVKSFRIPEQWERHIRIDHGYRNPAACLWIAISPDGEAYIYRELYEREWLIHELVSGDKKTRKQGLVELSRGEKLQSAKIDPSTKARRGSTGASDYDEYIKHWPESFPSLQMAKNDVQVGIDRVKSYLKVNPKNNKPLLYIFDTCVNLLEEITTYRYPELRSNQEGKKAEHEKPIKVDDHALDALRYMIVDLPEPYILDKEDERWKKYRPSELQLQEEYRELTSPKQKDPFDF